MKNYTDIDNKRLTIIEKVGDVHLGDQIAFAKEDNKILLGTVTGFGSANDLEPTLKIAEHPFLNVRISQIRKVINKCRFANLTAFTNNRHS